MTRSKDGFHPPLPTALEPFCRYESSFVEERSFSSHGIVYLITFMNAGGTSHFIPKA